MEVNELIKDIKKQFRLYMNGVVSQSMREKGLDYKLNFGIEVPRIKEIAAKYEKNHDLAQAMWKENISLKSKRFFCTALCASLRLSIFKCYI